MSDIIYLVFIIRHHVNCCFEQTHKIFIFCFFYFTDIFLDIRVDLLSLVDVFQPLSACLVHSIDSETDMKLRNVIAVLTTVHPEVQLHDALRLPLHVFHMCRMFLDVRSSSVRFAITRHTASSPRVRRPKFDFLRGITWIS